MKRTHITNRWLRWLIVLSLLTSLASTAAFAESTPTSPLTPEDKVYEGGDIILHKQGERIGPDEWEVTVAVDVNQLEIEPPPLEVVFVLDVSSTMNACAVMDQHNSYFTGGGLIHTHTKNCPADCTAVYHVHVSGAPSSPCYKMGGANGIVYYPRRVEVAKSAIKSLVSSLPNGTKVKYTYFSDDAGTIGSYDDLGQYDIQGETYIMKGVDLGIDQFSSGDATKVLVLVTDGEATDGAYTSAKFEAFAGTVFTVGFNHDDSNLSGMAKNGGSYYMASNPGDLTSAFNEISQKVMAMVVDPMGKDVKFTGFVDPDPDSDKGDPSYSGGTISWLPEDSKEMTGRVVEYSYIVKLNDQADRNAGTHSDVALNKDTVFRYGLQDGSGNTSDMREAEFPQPLAEYKISSIQTSWVEKGTNNNVKDPTEVESIICDFPVKDSTGEVIFPVFTQEYDDAPPVIPIEGSKNYYRYVGTTVTATDSDGNTLANVQTLKDIDVEKPVAYVVVHEYELVEANKLDIGGTKVLTGREFIAGDSFTFTINAVDPADAPMPEDENGNPINSVTITPTSGTSMAFSFGPISYTETGTYIYTIQEKTPTTEAKLGMVYDVKLRTLVVKTEEVDGQIVVSYTLDGVDNAPLLITNKYTAGPLTLSKKVSGNMGSKNQAFSFTISLPDMANKPVSFSTDGGATYSDLTLPVDGTYTCTLKHGESIIFYPITGDYTVTENDPGSYTASYTINGEQGEGAAATGTMTEAGVHVAFTNTLDVPPPTGIRTSSASALMGLCLAAGLLAILFAGRRSSCHAQ